MRNQTWLFGFVFLAVAACADNSGSQMSDSSSQSPSTSEDVYQTNSRGERYRMWQDNGIWYAENVRTKKKFKYVQENQGWQWQEVKATTRPASQADFFDTAPGSIVTLLHSVEFAEDDIYGTMGGLRGLGRPYLEANGGFSCYLVRQNLTFDDPPLRVGQTGKRMGQRETIPAQTAYKVLRTIENQPLTSARQPWGSSTSVPWPSTKNGEFVNRAAVGKFLIIEDQSTSRQFALNCGVSEGWFPERAGETVSAAQVGHLVRVNH